MRILVSNDDGYDSTGIQTLATALAERSEVTVVAPSRDRSGASNSLTLEWPIRVSHEYGAVYRVEGTPTDCVHLAITGLLEQLPDMVVSGINAGANLGDDVLYSGTVAAAMEGRSLGLPAIAISLASHEPTHYDTAAEVARRVIRRLSDEPLPADTILNINVPDVPWASLEGFEATRLGQRHRAEAAIRTQDPRGRPIYWIGPPGAQQDAGPGTDFNAVSRGFVSVTPIQVDLTRYPALDQISGWIGGLG
ncbi:5'(3')-nucleotidase/polyphosphatase [Spiribacter salinus M19-40]|uniref:5'-nucleotidase SurE n=2 Tax=Spiribacter salinus TaxID=1335746 RepID=R4VN20_9GAMM|nr:5'/3'-nucleotidase SurE [Spiribacter salinus]AGM40968.1 5'(3')-nucleotidase/polyphosphatase [Spiribacter salinus M19-40]MDR9413941.1 5'/3'-nucleotidase SurE [Spiribacter sp.]MDR9454980.1 5'/3'-nucleotidase SurE [Spiribacter sp.]TQF00349.1 MAG: 5'/3'-nucleotidase SurE [Spiribacter salinus]